MPNDDFPPRFFRWLPAVVGIPGALTLIAQVLPVAIIGFSAIIGGLCVSALAATRAGDRGLIDRLEAAISRFDRLPRLARLLRSVGDGRLAATAAVAVVVSPVLAVLLARVTRPTQRLHSTVVVSTISYGLAFGGAYAGGGTLLGLLW